MKKLIALFLVCIMSLCFVSCTNNTDNIQNLPNELNSDFNRESNTKIQETEATTFAENPKLVDVTGLSVDTAKANLEAIGFNVTVKEENSDTIDEGLVISQQPAVENNLKLKRGDTVTLIVSKGKAINEKVYLDTIAYTDFKNENPKNNFSAYTGEDGQGNPCERAINYYIDGKSESYSESIQKNNTYSYKVYYKINKQYSKFVSELMAGDWIYDTANIKIYGDDKMLYSMSVTDKTNPVPLEFDIKDVDMFCIEISTVLSGYGNDSNIILNKPYFE